jgi:hypothetical protein
MEQQESTSFRHYNFSRLLKVDKEEVRNADPNGGLCLITSTKAALNYCHCIPKNMMQANGIVCVYSL